MDGLAIHTEVKVYATTAEFALVFPNGALNTNTTAFRSTDKPQVAQPSSTFPGFDLARKSADLGVMTWSNTMSPIKSTATQRLQDYPGEDGFDNGPVVLYDADSKVRAGGQAHEACL